MFGDTDRSQQPAFLPFYQMGWPQYGEADVLLSPHISVGHLLDRAAQKLDIANGTDPRIESELRWMIGVSYRNLARYNDAVRHLGQCVRLRSHSLPLGTHHDLNWGACYLDMFVACWEMGKWLD